MVPLRPLTMHTFPAAHPSTQRPRPSFPPRRPSCRVFAGGARGGSPPTPARSGSRRRARSDGPRGGPAPENVTEEGVSSRATVREFLRSVFCVPGSGFRPVCVTHLHGSPDGRGGHAHRRWGSGQCAYRNAVPCTALRGRDSRGARPKESRLPGDGAGPWEPGSEETAVPVQTPATASRPPRRHRAASDGVGRCPTVFPCPLPRMRARYVDDFGHSADGPEHIGQAEVRVRHRRAQRRRARQSGSNSGRGREPRGRGAGGFPSGDADDFGHRRAHNSPERAS